MGVAAAVAAADVVAADAEDEEKQGPEAAAAVVTEQQRLEWEGTGDRASSIRRKRRCRMRASRRSFFGEKKRKK